MIFDIHLEGPMLALFGKAAKVCKASGDANSWRGWLIFLDLFNKWVVEGVASYVNDFTLSSTHTRIRKCERQK